MSLHGATFPHTCGKEFRVKTIEWPPKVVMCPHCDMVLLLSEYDEETGHVSYISRYKYEI